MRRYIDLVESLTPLEEAPVDNYQLIGDFEKSSSFRHATDRKLLSNPAMVKRVKNMWRKTEVPFDLYFVNHADAVNRGGDSVTEVGEVSQKWIETNMPRVYPMLKFRSDAVTVIYNGNSGAERVPLSPWIMAHRFGHAVRLLENSITTNLPEFREATEELYRVFALIMNGGFGTTLPETESRYWGSGSYQVVEPLMRAFYHKVGTMRVARDGNLRSGYEFLYELLAQYMITGKVRFNPLPKSLQYYAGKGNKRFLSWKGAEYDYKYYDGVLDDLAETLTEIFSNLLHNCIGRIFII